MGDKDPHNDKKEQVISQQNYLSDDLIIEEILTRLPIKSILRFKSVSKQWYSTLSSSHFANAHLMKSPFSHPSAPVNILFIMGRNCCYVFSYDDDQISGNFEDNLVKIDPEFSVQKDDLILNGSCNGLICFTSRSGKCFILWNPAIRKLHKYESHGFFDHLDEGDIVYTNHGFGYSSFVDDYKYVEMSTIFQANTKSDIVCIFSLRENRWRKIDLCNDHLPRFGNAVLVSEKLYWSALSKEEAGILLISFDLGAETVDVIKFVLDMSDLLGVMGGSLSKFNYQNTFTGDQLMHILEPPAVVKSIGLPKGLILDRLSQMIGFTKTDKFFVMGGPFTVEAGAGQRSRTLGIVDTCTRPMQYTTLLNINELTNIARYVPSLVSPFPIDKSLEA